MKKTILLLVLSVFLFSCNNDDDAPSSENTIIVGTWKLDSVYMDPGDGSGTFETVTSERTITFNSDGTYISNGFICDISVSADASTSGSYSTSNTTIDVSICSLVPTTLNYTIENSFLIINYQCIEPCQARYTKL